MFVPKGRVWFTLKTLNAEVFNLTACSWTHINISIDYSHWQTSVCLSGPNACVHTFLNVCTSEQVSVWSWVWMCGLSPMSSHVGHFTCECVCVCVCVCYIDINIDTTLYILRLHASEYPTTFQYFRSYCTKELPRQLLHIAFHLPIIQGYSSNLLTGVLNRE